MKKTVRTTGGAYENILASLILAFAAPMLLLGFHIQIINLILKIKNDTLYSLALECAAIICGLMILLLHHRMQTNVRRYLAPIELVILVSASIGLLGICATESNPFLSLFIFFITDISLSAIYPILFKHFFQHLTQKNIRTIIVTLVKILFS